MRGVVLSCVVLVTGCDVVFGLTDRDAAVDARADSAGSADDAMTPPEQCAFSVAAQLAFASNITPMHDFADDGAGRAFVMGFVTELSGTVPRHMGVLLEKGVWTHDQTSRDQVGGFDGVRPDGDPQHIYAVENISAYRYVSHYELGTAGWTSTGMQRIDDRERVGNSRVLGGKRVYVMTQKPSAIDQRTRMVLRVLDGASWNVEDRMSAINTAQIPDLGVLARDGLTLVYSARDLSASQYDLYVSTRPTLDDNFPVGTAIPGLNTIDADEVEPWFSGACDELYFRRGATFFDGAAQPSTIWHAPAP